MRSIRRSGVTAMTAALALALGAVPVAFTAGILAGADEESTLIQSAGLPEGGYGYLAIQAGQGPDRIDWFAPGSTTPVSQTISRTQTNCALVTDPLDSASVAPLPVMKFDGKYAGRKGTVSGAESWAPGSIGVAEKTSGTSCSQVNSPSESLDLSVGPAVVPNSPATGRVVASAAYLDVELKQDARILGTATLNGSTVGYFELQSGSTIGLTTKPSGVVAGIPYAIQECNNPADSGPDAGPKDNCRWAVSNPSGLGEDDGIMFDTLSLKAVNGAFSVEYGRDGIPVAGPPLSLPTNIDAGASVLELTLIDGVLGCDSTNNATPVVQATTGEPRVQVRRLPNAPATGTTTIPPCTAVPYTLENGPSSATFLKPTNQQTTAQFVFDMVWTAPITSVASPDSLPTTFADYETGGRPVPLGWCPNPTYAVVEGATRLTGLATTADLPDQDVLGSSTYPRKSTTQPGTPLPDTQFSCIGIRSTQVVDDSPADSVQIAEQIYVLGDIKLLR